MSAPPAPSIPTSVESVLRRLWDAGHAAYAVGGGVRDALLGRDAYDWDVATDARPERIQELFPGSRYQNRFGTVKVWAGSERPEDEVEVTTFRRDHVYGDHRRPDSVEFTESLEEDLLRRDFTVNAIAWGRAANGTRHADAAEQEPRWVDPTNGMADLEARALRAVGDPDVRFDEDALRLLRAARLAAQLDFRVEPETRAAMSRQAHLGRHVASERVGAELLRLLVSERPSIGLRLLGWTRVLDAVLPELATQRGVPQNKVRGRDLWDHTNATVDAAARLAPGDVTLALAALLHDSGKPETRAEGRFLGHEEVGARIAEKVLRRLAIGGAQSERVVRLVRWHMFGYDEKWRDAAVRRFLAKVGPDLLDDLLRLREADNMGSGRPREATGVDELRARARAELDRQVPLSLADLAVDGRDLIDEVGLTPGPIVGALLARLLDSVISEPSRNVRDRLLADARHWAREPGIASRARRGADGDDDASERPDASGGDVTGGSVR